MLTVEIKNMRVFGHHGLYAGEELTGEFFEVNLRVSYDEGIHRFDSIQETINYEQLVNLVKERLAHITGLLEKLVVDLSAAIKKQFPQTRELSISVHKLNPPVENFQGQLGVTLNKRFDA